MTCTKYSKCTCRHSGSWSSGTCNRSSNCSSNGPSCSSSSTAGAPTAAAAAAAPASAAGTSSSASAAGTAAAAGTTPGHCRNNHPCHQIYHHRCRHIHHHSSCQHHHNSSSEQPCKTSGRDCTSSLLVGMGRKKGGEEQCSVGRLGLPETRLHRTAGRSLGGGRLTCLKVWSAMCC